MEASFVAVGVILSGRNVFNRVSRTSVWRTSKQLKTHLLSRTRPVAINFPTLWARKIKKSARQSDNVLTKSFHPTQEEGKKCCSNSLVYKLVAAFCALFHIEIIFNLPDFHRSNPFSWITKQTANATTTALHNVKIDPLP